MRIALVHDYIKEYGGAERVLEVLHEMYPDAPIYTAFYQKDSLAYEKFKAAKIIPSWVQYIPFFATKLHSPLRFLAPVIWGSFSSRGRPAFGWDLSQYDVVISSASWYITKGFGTRGTDKKKPIEICYCHTPPRWLYGYKTSIAWQKYWPVKLYGNIVGYFMRKYDWAAAQKVNYFVANSKEVQGRIKEFYKRKSTVIYPPVSLPISRQSLVSSQKLTTKDQRPATRSYYFMVARLVGGKGIEMAIEAAERTGIKLKIAGAPVGYYTPSFAKASEGKVEFLGHVTDEALVELYSGAKAFFALSYDEDFGITPVEAMLCGTPVIAYYGGGYKETVVDPSVNSKQSGQTGVFFREYSVDSLVKAIQKFEKIKIDPKACIQQAQKFSKEQFMHSITRILQTLS